MKSLKPGQARFRIHGPDTARDDQISASHFANKLGTLVRALKEADRRINGALLHDYKIVKLESSSPTVTLLETPGPKFESGILAQSGIKGFEDCADAVLAGERDRALKYGKCADYIRKLAGGAQKTYGYAEVWTRTERIFRVDEFLSEQTAAVLHPEIVRPVKDGTEWFKGIVDASFDGAIKAVDLRGELPEIKLILTAGGKQLDCVCRAEDKEIIRTNLDSRVRVYGSAYYDGKSGLPRRIEVRDIEPITGDVDFSVWRGAFEPFEPLDWEPDNT